MAFYLTPCTKKGVGRANDCVRIPVTVKEIEDIPEGDAIEVTLKYDSHYRPIRPNITDGGFTLCFMGHNRVQVPVDHVLPQQQNAVVSLDWTLQGTHCTAKGRFANKAGKKMDATSIVLCASICKAIAPALQTYRLETLLAQAEQNARTFAASASVSRVAAKRKREEAAADEAAADKAEESEREAKRTMQTCKRELGGGGSCAPPLPP
jgi:ribosomal protein L12E/L44/L45/RPP1/RPP2